MSGCRTIPMPWYGKGWVPWGRRRQMTRDSGLLKLPSYKDGGHEEIFFWSFPLCLSNGNLWSNCSMYRDEATAALSPCGYGARRLHHFEANTTTDIIDFFGLLILNRLRGCKEGINRYRSMFFVVAWSRYCQCVYFVQHDDSRRISKA